MTARPASDEHVEALLSARIEAGDFPSAVYAVARGGQLRFAGALGDAVRAPERRAATLETIYDLASLTKPLVTGLLCALMVERKLLSLDDGVARHLPEFGRDDKRALTVRHLVTHTSGLPAWRPLYALAEGRERALEVVAAQPLEYEPGARVVYSDLGFITLGLLLCRLASAELPALARREIFEPLGLRRTFFNPDRAFVTETAACESEGNAYEREMCRAGHGVADAVSFRDSQIWGEVHDGNAHFLGGAAGHAGLFSTARETHLIAEQFLPSRTRLLSADTCALFRTNMTDGLNEARSLAWQLAATPASTAGPLLAPDSFGHLGFTGTSCWVDPVRDAVFILLTNRTHARGAQPFVNINSVRREFHALAVEALERGG
ncbi:MAG TPA: serine hydrolase domain-containing protein [Pyrinomonadaceae bacterium]|nr:serine hydrolase domain-containing protein [Pyrinomonadaceae bacterium]